MTERAVFAACLALAAAGCAPPPPAVEPLPLEEEDWRRPAGSAGIDEAKVIAAMRSAARERPTPDDDWYATGPRFSDAPRAIAAATAWPEVTMAVVREEAQEGRVTFHLLTWQDWPARLVVEEREGERPWEVVLVEIGRVPSRHLVQAEALRNAFDTEMVRLGRKRRLREAAAGE